MYAILYLTCFIFKALFAAIAPGVYSSLLLFEQTFPTSSMVLLIHSFTAVDDFFIPISAFTHKYVLN